ncbi:MAG TPA: dihydrolipoyl dehydrogenase [Coriobacteriia bacterium]|nr:dihydrolipoyl dehydrogenase [Coriobacteriia bacterium]
MRIAVLGGGPGGYSAAFEAARLGADVVLIEKERLGGTCLNWGCIPTKAILRSAHIVSDTRHAADYGLKAAPAEVDVAALRARKEGVVDELVSQVEGSAKRLKVEVIYGEGTLTAPKTIEVTTAEGAVTVDADAVILATGSVPFLLPSIDHSLDRVWTSDEATALKDIPASVVIIGGGVIGLEFADAYANFGSTVHVVELTPSVLPGNDKRVQREVQKALEAIGVVFHLGIAVDSVAESGDKIIATLTDGSTIEADIVLSAPGRRPNGLGFGFEEAGVEMDRAAVKVDEFYRTNQPGVYAIGDLIGGMMLAHVAEAEGEAAARNAVAELKGERATQSVNLAHVPAAVYTEPGIGVVGSTRDSAKERGLDVVQVVMKFAGNGKALGEGHSEGFVQIVAENGTGRIVGCQIVGPSAAELIQQISIPMAGGMTVGQVGHSVFGHPTLSEVIKFACIEAANKTGTSH